MDLSLTQKILLTFSIALVTFIFGALTFRLFRLIFQKRHNEHSHLLDRKFKYSFAALLSAISFYISIQIIDLGDFSYSDYFYKGLHIFFILIIAGFFIKVSEFIREVLLLRHDINQANNLEARKFQTQLVFIHRLVTIFIVLITLSLILMSFEGVRKVGTSILASAGIATLIIGLAAQKSISNLLAGFQIAFTQPIRIDDVVIVEGEWGKVEEISLTYVIVNIWDQRRLVLPISYFLEKPFQNWTRTSADIIGSVFLYLDYNVPLKNIRTRLDELLAETNLWDGRVKAVQVTDSTKSEMEVRILVSASNASNAFDLRCYIREELIQYVQKEFPEALPKQRVEIDANNKDAIRGM